MDHCFKINGYNRNRLQVSRLWSAWISCSFFGKRCEDRGKVGKTESRKSEDVRIFLIRSIVISGATFFVPEGRNVGRIEQQPAFAS